MRLTKFWDSLPSSAFLLTTFSSILHNIKELNYHTFLTLGMTTEPNFAQLISMKTFPGQKSAQIRFIMFQNDLFPYLPAQMGNDGNFG